MKYNLASAGVTPYHYAGKRQASGLKQAFLQATQPANSGPAETPSNNTFVDRTWNVTHDPDGIITTPSPTPPHIDFYFTEQGKYIVEANACVQFIADPESLSTVDGRAVFCLLQNFDSIYRNGMSLPGNELGGLKLTIPLFIQQYLDIGAAEINSTFTFTIFTSWVGAGQVANFGTPINTNNMLEVYMSAIITKLA